MSALYATERVNSFYSSIIDHNSNEFRGLLCTNCNTGIGKLGESLDIIDSAKVYLASRANLPMPSMKRAIGQPFRFRGRPPFGKKAICGYLS